MLEAKGFKHTIPFISFKPIIVDQHTVVCLFINGLGGTNRFVEIMNHPFFDRHYLVSYERAGQGDNKNLPKRWPSFFLKELDEVINKIHEIFPNKQIYILGESWGSALAYLYYKHHDKKIAGVFCWNMPHNIKDASHSPRTQKLIIFAKMLITIPFGIHYKDYHAKDTSEIFSSNPLLIRLSKVANANKIMDLCLYLASWWSFKPAWRFLYRNLENAKYNIYYIQSGEDFMINRKYFERFQKRWEQSTRIKYFEKGFHILSMEEPLNDQLYEFIQNHINS